MTSPEYANDAYEHHVPEWERLGAYIRRRIEATAEVIEFADEKVVAQKVAELNKFLKNEGNVNILARVRAESPLFIGKIITENGVEECPVVDKDYLERDTFEGVFTGCVSVPLAVDDMNLLFYDIKISDGYNGLHLRTPVDGAPIEISYPVDDSWEEEIRGAFAILETVNDTDYQEVVEELSRVFWGKNDVPALRLQMIGVYVTELLAHEASAELGDLVEAIGAIVGGSIEEELLYEAKGCVVDEVRLEDGRPLVRAKNESKSRILKPVGVRFVNNFEICSSSGEDLELKLGDTLQPALVFFDETAKTEVDYPLRFIASIEEYEYDAAAPRQLQPHFIDRQAGLTNGKTCGEAYREYWQTSSDGV